jgi:Dolichyl-phosphate-mannose-protein mannosyltransferase
LRLRRPTDAAGWVFLALIVVGIALRVLAILSWWPVSPTLEDGYQRFASNPFLDPRHPAGYGLIVAALGHLTRQIAFTVLVQHLVGFASALLFYAATKRVTGSAWAGLLPMAIVLIDPDEILLEHAIMSESWAVLTIAASLYGAVRSADEPQPWWRWPLLTGVALAAAVAIRTASLAIVPFIPLALVLWRRRPFARWREHLLSALVAACVTGALLLGFAGLSSASGQRFGIEPSPGWYLYGRVAQFADCKRFTPPPGTQSLCQTIPPTQRPTGYYYMYDPHSPAVRKFGTFGASDSIVGGWARRALEAQVGDFLATAWSYLRGYYVPSWLPARIRDGSTELDPQLDFTNPLNPIYVAVMHKDLETYYDKFTVHPRHWGLQFLHDWQRVIRFGATALFITTLLTILGLFIGTRRSRVAVFLFGVGGVALVVPSVLTGTYAGRYTIPMAGPLMAAAAITLTEIYRAVSARRAPA